MSTSSEKNKTIAKNTLLLYIRMVLVMGVTLYTSRIVLNALGVHDYGIYNVVGGIVTLFSIVSGSLSSAISRFITYELGLGSPERIKKIFATSLSIQIVLSLIVLVLCSTVGFWFLNQKMNIEPQRLAAANWVLLFSILTFVVNLLSIPYNAVIVAHEKMAAFAYVSIVEVALKLGVAFLILSFSSERLVVYAALLFAVAVVIRLIYGVYCTRHFPECSTGPKYDKSIYKEMSGFAGWNFIGTSSSVIRDQGNNVVLNLLFGTVVNAAYGIGMQVSNAAYSFSQNFMTALNPQITKSYALGDFAYLSTLVLRGARFSFYLLWMIAVVILLNTDYLLSLWLGSVPDYTVRFVQLFTLFVVSESISQPLITAMLATGDIRNYQIVVGGLKLLNLPVSYLLLKMGYSPYVTVVVAIVISQGMLFLRFIFLKSKIHMGAWIFFKKVYLNVLFVGAVSIVLAYVCTNGIAETFPGLVLKCGITIFVCIATVWLIGCTAVERAFIFNKIKSLKNRL